MKVLVVDDHAVNRMLPLAILRKAGVAVAEASGGAEALAKVAADPEIDHLLLDVSMPGMSGLEVCAELRKGPPRELRLVAYTAHAFESERQQFLSAGFDDVLVKPISKDELLRALAVTQP
jgi:CheY-like chemotaxis protein